MHIAAGLKEGYNEKLPSDVYNRMPIIIRK
jgi:hypothetical protein